MRIPNYLQRSPSGIWHFRQRIPAPIAQKLGKVEVKRSLQTREHHASYSRAPTMKELLEAVKILDWKIS